MPDPAQRHERLGRRRQRHGGGGRHAIERDVGLQEAVEEDQAVHAQGVQPGHEVGQRAEVGRELHRHRDGDGVLHLGHRLQVALLDLGGALLRVGLDRVEVHLQPVGAGGLDVAGVLGPAPRGDAVQAGDDRDPEGALRVLEEGEVVVRADPLRREEGPRLRARLGAPRQLLLEGAVGRLDLLLEERAQHHRPGAVRLGDLQVVDAIRERRAPHDHGRGQGKAHEAGGQVRHVSPPGTARPCARACLSLTPRRGPKLPVDTAADARMPGKRDSVDAPRPSGPAGQDPGSFTGTGLPPPRMNRQDRATGAPHHPLGDGPHERVLDPGPPVRAQHEQVDPGDRGRRRGSPRRAPPPASLHSPLVHRAPRPAASTRPRASPPDRPAPGACVSSPPPSRRGRCSRGPDRRGRG